MASRQRREEEGVESRPAGNTTSVRSIGIIGAGYVGLVSAACFAELGNRVVCVESDAAKLARLRRGEIPIHEPSLGELIARNVRAERLRFGASVAEAVLGAEFVFIAVGTPTSADGHADVSAVLAVAREIGRALDGPKIVVLKSTVPVETGELISTLIKEHAAGEMPVSVVSNPEFLREGSAVSDFLKPDRVVIGTADPDAERALRDLYAPLGAPFVVTDVRTAEMIKYAANAFLATKISFANEIANVCELLGVDVRTVCEAIALDRRIGPSCLNPGIGYGGSCLPKDVRALAQIAIDRDYAAPLLHAVELVNRAQIDRTVAKLERELGTLRDRTVAVLGLAFKPDTDDVRDAPALALVRSLLESGVFVRAHDPIAVQAAAAALPAQGRLTFASDPYEAAAGADALLLATEWNEFRALDFARCARVMRGDAVVDGRNAFDPREVRAAGLRYAGVGRITPRAENSPAFAPDPSRDRPRAPSRAAREPG
jgi:UDPglucose 6-dehydrogenase